MPWLAPTDRFDADGIDAPVVGIASRLVQHDSGLHRHRKGQLLFAYAGSIRITMPGLVCLLPPIRVAWIPPDTEHRVQIRAAVDYRSVYLAPDHAPVPAHQAAVLDMTPLLREVFERISHAPFDTDWRQGPARHLLAVCMDELRVARPEPMLLPVPTDPRLAGLDLDTLPPPLAHMARQFGASARTITRIFQRETGMGYQDWRKSWRLLRAVDLLASGRGVSTVAFDLGFSSDSAFIAFFRQMTGQTPRRYVLGSTAGAGATEATP